MEKIGFGTAPRQCGIYSKPQVLLQKTCLFHAFETLAAYARCCPSTWAERHFGHLFPKIYFCSFKSYIFDFNTPQVNLISD